MKQYENLFEHDFFTIGGGVIETQRRVDEKRVEAVFVPQVEVDFFQGQEKTTHITIQGKQTKSSKAAKDSQLLLESFVSDLVDLARG